MKFTLAIGALAASAAASPELQKRQSAFNTGSALMVLETALPGSLLSLAITNSNAASSVIASEFAAGATPSWFTGLPSDIQTYLLSATPTANAGAASSVLGSAASSAASAAGSLVILTPPRLSPATPTGTPGSTPGGASTPATPTSGSSRTSSGSGSSSTSGSGSGSGSSGGSSRAGGSSSTGGVPAQTAALGMGVAGFAAAVGLIAL